MDLDALRDLTTSQLLSKKFKDAETNLLRAREEAERSGNEAALAEVLSLLVQVYCSMGSAEIGKGATCSRQREDLKPTAYNKLQTASVLSWAADDYPGAIEKLHEAIRQSKTEGDSVILYSSLSLLGWCLLRLNRNREAADVLKEIEQMILDKKRFVAGDETAFLESAHKQNIEGARVKRIAAMVGPLCREPEFRRRLEALATNDTQL